MDVTTDRRFRIVLKENSVLEFWRYIREGYYLRRKAVLLCCDLHQHCHVTACSVMALTVWGPVVNICTARFSIQQFYVLPTQFMCFVWIWEQTAIISLYSINWLVFITETECVYCAVRTGSLYTASLTVSNSTFCPHSVFMCFVWIWEQTAIISLYNINWLVFITETECVYCAVRTGSLYTASLTVSNSTFCPHSVFMCFVWIWEQTAVISLYSINWLVFITATECVYWAVRTVSLYER